MARRKSYSRNRKPSISRYLAILVLLFLVILVIWQFRAAPDPIDDLSQENIEAAIHAQANNAQPTENTPVTNTNPTTAARPNTLENQPERTVAPPATNTPPETVTQRNPITQNQLDTNTRQQNTQDRQTNPTEVAQNAAPPPPPAIQPIIKQTVIPNPVADKIYVAGKEAFDARDIITARDRLSEALNLGLQNNLDQSARDMLNQAADLWLFSRSTFPNDPFCLRHNVASGEYLSTIARKYTITHELISRINGIADPSKLRAGQPIKVVQGPFHAKVELSNFRLTVYLDKTVVKTYNISIGKPGRETPTGLWVVQLKQLNPAWTDPDTGAVYRPNDPDNPLGTRWIALEGLVGAAVGRTGIGIHGTIKPGEIRQQASRGCIRLFNGEVQELYDLMVPGKSQICVVE